MKVPNFGHLLRYRRTSRTTTRKNHSNPLTASTLDSSFPSHLFRYHGQIFLPYLTTALPQSLQMKPYYLNTMTSTARASLDEQGSRAGGQLKKRGRFGA
jgi:hypothetical protein